ncbi:9344_t:CDS:2, partial [Gigaspora margarita]
LYTIANSCHKLEYLNISNRKRFSEIVIWNIIHSCPKLQEFDIYECKNSYTIIKKIGLYLKIKYINPDIASRYLKRIGQGIQLINTLKEIVRDILPVHILKEIAQFAGKVAGNLKGVRCTENYMKKM